MDMDEETELDDVIVLIPPEDMDPEMRLKVTIETLRKTTRKGIPIGDWIGHIFLAETALHEGDLDKFDEQIKLALKDIVDDEGIEARIEWSRWLLETLSLFENVPQGIMDVFSEAEGSYERGEHEKASALIDRLKGTAEDRLGDQWIKLRSYTKGQYKASKNIMEKGSRRQVKRLIPTAESMMYIGGTLYQRKALRSIREAQEIILSRTTVP